MMSHDLNFENSKIFLSYSWKDKALARRFVADLKKIANTLEIWVDQSSVFVGENLVERIDKGLEWCDTVLLIWSKAASQSNWVKKEWTTAFYFGKKIVPCKLDDTPLPPLLASTVWIDYSKAQDEFF